MSRKPNTVKQGSDIPAIALLSTELKNIRGIRDPPSQYSAAGKYRKDVQEIINKSVDTTTEVNKYAGKINEIMDQVREALNKTTTTVQEAILTELDRTVSTGNPRGSGQIYSSGSGTGQIYSSGSDSESGQPDPNMEYINELMQLEVSKERLEEAVVQCQVTVEKMQNNIVSSQADIDKLKANLKRWQEAKKQNYEDEKREEEERRRRIAEERNERLEEERRRQMEEKERKQEEAEERKRREEEERLKLEEEKKIRAEEKRQRKKEEERKRKEEEERRKREEEERKRQEEEELRRRQIEEEERRKREEAEKEEAERKERERLQREEEERKRQEEEELRLRQLENEERRKREEAERRERREAERKERERLQREEEARRFRLDPNNWKQLVYTRHNDEVDGQRSHHQGISCVVTAVPGSINDDDIQCLASDEDTDILPALTDGEKILSSVIELEAREGPLNCEYKERNAVLKYNKYERVVYIGETGREILERMKEHLNDARHERQKPINRNFKKTEDTKIPAPMRAFIPHQPVPDASDELVVKISINGSDWVMMNSVSLPKSGLIEKNIRLSGVELDNFDTAKVVVVARPKSQNLIIDKTGTSQYSMYDKNVKLFVPRDAFKTPTDVKFSVKTVPDDILSSLESGSDCIDPIISTGPLVSLACHSPPAKDIEIDLLKSSESVSSVKAIKGKSYQLYKTNRSAWQIADVEFKGRGKDMSISLPAAKTHYSVMEVEVPQSTSKEDVAKVAAALFDCMNKSVVRFIVKQKEQNPEHILVQCLRREVLSDRLIELTTMGYTAGPDTSREFYLTDGQRLQVFCSGNIEPVVEEKQMATMPFYAYMDTAKQEYLVQVKDKYKQRDLPEYIGNIHCQVLSLNFNPSNDSQLSFELDIELPISIPKRDHIPFRVKTARVRFPHHLSALTMFLSCRLTGQGLEDDVTDWFSILCKLSGGKRKMQTLRNHAKNKSTDLTDQNVCRIMLEDWMKGTNVSEDKLGPIVSALNQAGLQWLGRECEKLVEYHKVNLNDTAIQEISHNVSEEPRTFGERLGLPEDAIKKCISENTTSEPHQVLALLTEWRHSKSAIEKGTTALEFLASLVKQ